jgi:hypothetical protein
MIAYYEITKGIYDHLKADPDINTVVIGSLDKIDINKQSIFPLGHILVGSAQFINGMVRFTLTVSCMDIVDIVKDDLPKDDEQWKGLDNRHDIANTMLNVIEGLDRSIKKGSLQATYELQSMTAEPFEDRFDNLLTGWSATFVIDIYNSVQNCSTGD